MTTTNTAGKPSILRSEGFAVTGYSLLGALPFSMLLFMPMFVGGFVNDFGFSDTTAGYVASINIAGSGLAAFLAFLWVQRASIRHVVFGALLVFIACNFASAFIPHFWPLSVLRFAEGFAAGTMTSGILVAIAKTLAPDRNYGIWLAAQLLYGTIGYLVIPELFTNFGVESGFIAFGALGVLAIPLVRFIPKKGEEETVAQSEGAYTLRRHPLWGVASIFVFYIGLNIIWAYLERIGDSAGLTLETIGQSLSIANFAGLAGAIIVAILGTRFGRFWPITIILVLTSASVLALFGTPSAAIYTVSTSVYLFGWIFLVPLMLGAIAELDKSGKHTAFANAALSIGLAIGPAIGGQLIGDSESYDMVIYASSAVMFLSLFVIIPILIAGGGAKDDVVD